VKKKKIGWEWGACPFEKFLERCPLDPRKTPFLAVKMQPVWIENDK